MNMEIIEAIRILITVLLSAQFTYGCTILLLGRVMTDYYEWGTFEHPNTIFQKVTNAFMIVTISSGYYINKKLMKYNWFTRKLLLLFALILQGIISIIVYYIVYGGLKAIFL
ncbi:hypothetical protein MXL46_05610 [Heyndrickxia sporothermodurans]|nr:hypothetical protein [Heyndrickxia sporothermodurans]MEB6548584.1 hypothetical protein [Heyndrickxia sporothermodurans]